MPDEQQQPGDVPAPEPRPAWPAGDAIRRAPAGGAPAAAPTLGEELDAICAQMTDPR